MARQDIYATLIDDIIGVRCTTSSRRGKVGCIRLAINTDVAGEGEIEFCFDKEMQTVIIKDDLPNSWKRVRQPIRGTIVPVFG